MAPVRTCVGCRRKASPEELVRVVRDAEGRVLLGRSLPGRGAWLCAGSVACLDRAARRGLARALRGEVDPASVRALRDALASARGRSSAAVGAPVGSILAMCEDRGRREAAPARGGAGPSPRERTDPPVGEEDPRL